MNKKTTILILYPSGQAQIKKISEVIGSTFLQDGHRVLYKNSSESISEDDIQEADMICLGSENGNIHKNFRSLANKQLVLFANNRQALHRLRKNAGKLNASLLTTAFFPVKQSLFYPLNSWLNYQKYGHQQADHPAFSMTPYGIPQEEMEYIHNFSQNLLGLLPQKKKRMLAFSR